MEAAVQSALLEMGLGPVAFAALGFAAFATSILSAIVGMAGGITLLSLMLLFYDPMIAIPLHGVVQLVSNSSRAVIQRQHIRWNLIWRYGLFLIPMGFVGIELAQALPPSATRRLIGAFVLLATFAPKLLLLGTHPENSAPTRRFVLLGAAVGVLNVTIGATGPLIAPFFLNLGMNRFEIIGTKAACQVVGHLGKILVFGVIGFVYSAYLPLLLVLCLCVVLGTMTGSRLLHRFDERWFVRLYKTVLAVVALSLLLGGSRGESVAAIPATTPVSSVKPNILILMAEDMGPRVGAFGDPVAVTPALDALARDGVRYPNTFTTAGVCAPSRAAHIMGIHQMAFGAQHMRSRAGGYLAVPPPEAKAYPELLRRAGYYTFTDGKIDLQFSGIRAGSGPFTIWDREGIGSDWRDCPKDRPFFGLINFQHTHESAIFPRSGLPRSGMHLMFRIFYGYLFWGHDDVVTPADVSVPPYYPDTAPVRRDIARHYNNINRMDIEVAKIREKLALDGLAESTIIVWVTDHGDGLPRAKRELFDSGIRVPMIIYWPDELQPQRIERGSIDEQLVSFVDLAPTVLHWAGVEIPGDKVGRVFAPDSRGTEGRSFVYAARDRLDEFPDRQRAVRDRRYKYIRNYDPGTPGARPLAFRQNLDSMLELWEQLEADTLDDIQRSWFEPRPKEELYDLDLDPHEVQNLAGDPESMRVLSRMSRALDEWLDSTLDLSEISEAELAERFWPGGVQPETAPPAIGIESGSRGARNLGEQAIVTLASSTHGASLGYRLRSNGERAWSPWSIYTEPFRITKGTAIEAKAVRYGYAESATSDARVRR